MSEAPNRQGTGNDSLRVSASEISPLKILIVGGGIGGLTAAIALRKQGHNIEILEKSKFATELGAAVHLAPNANGVLRRLGIFADELGANVVEKMIMHTARGDLLGAMDMNEEGKLWQHKYLFGHRISLHNGLKEKGVAPAGPGEGEVQLHTSTEVVDVDPTLARVTLADGRMLQGDVVIGADGVHSVTRKFVPGGDVKPFCNGQSAFRFVIPRETAMNDPVTKFLVEETGTLRMWMGKDRRVVLYPTSNNTLLNFVCIHPVEESEAQAGNDWDQAGSLDLLLHIFRDFEGALLSLLGMAEPKSIKVWKLLDMATIPTWANNRLALLGDAAHPFLPHQGQGAAIAIEDAVALGVLLGRDTPNCEIPERLKLYNEVRHERASKIQQGSRILGDDRIDRGSLDMASFTNYNLGHDEWDNSTQKLREWTWKRIPNAYWRMPTGFGPMPGPRQTHLGLPRDATNAKTTSASITFKTSRTMLQTMFPHTQGQRWKFQSPGTYAYATFTQTTLEDLEWLGGLGYKLISLSLHGVEYEQEDGSTVKGQYVPVMFEDMADPIVSGREELGIPKVYSTIDSYRHEASYTVRASWQGRVWGTFNLKGLVEENPAIHTPTNGSNIPVDSAILVHRYIPKVGREDKGIAADESVVVDDFSNFKPPPKVQKAYRVSTASFNIDPLSWQMLPTLHHIVSRLAELPIYEIADAKVVESTGLYDFSGARPIA